MMEMIRIRTSPHFFANLKKYKLKKYIVKILRFVSLRSERSPRSRNCLFSAMPCRNTRAQHRCAAIHLRWRGGCVWLLALSEIHRGASYERQGQRICSALDVACSHIGRMSHCGNRCDMCGIGRYRRAYQ